MGRIDFNTFGGDLAGLLDMYMPEIMKQLDAMGGMDADMLDGTDGADFATETELAASGSAAVHWDNLTTVPAGLDDGDDDTTYTAGAGLVLDGAELSAVMPGAAWGLHAATTIDSGGDVGWYTSITVGADGLPVISSLDGTIDDLKVAHCSNVSCSSATITTVASDGSVGFSTSITVGADGLPVISYYDDTNDDLRVAHCSNVFCVPYARRR